MGGFTGRVHWRCHGSCTAQSEDRQWSPNTVEAKGGAAGERRLLKEQGQPASDASRTGSGKTVTRSGPGCRWRQSAQGRSTGRGSLSTSGRTPRGALRGGVRADLRAALLLGLDVRLGQLVDEGGGIAPLVPAIEGPFRCVGHDGDLPGAGQRHVGQAALLLGAGRRSRPPDWGGGTEAPSA